MKTLPPQREMERASQGKDASYDGLFFVAVRTTGIFCRPSCPARKPRPKNVEYFPSAEDCLLAGYRACKRCRPMQTAGQSPEWVERLLAKVADSNGSRLRDADLRSLSIDPVRARRYFRQHHGMTFQAWQRQRHLGQALGQLRQGTRTLQAGLRSGYESDSGFRGAFQDLFGTTPGRGRQSDCIMMQMLESPLGPLICGATSSTVVLLEFADRRAVESQLKTLQQRFTQSIVPGSNKHIQHAGRELARYFAGQLRQFSVPIGYPGTSFQHRVWQRLLEIPYGETLSYARLAEDIGHVGSQRAVGTANGKNRLAILIPCHRVVNKNGNLGGYGGGLWRKQFLLKLEQSVARGEPQGA